MEDRLIQTMPAAASQKQLTVIKKGVANVKKGMSREAIEEKLKKVKMESETAGFIHLRDLRKHIRRLEKQLKGLNAAQTIQAERKMSYDETGAGSPWRE